MRELKRFTSLLIVAAMLLTTVVFAADEVSTQAADSELYNYNVMKLSAFGTWTLTGDGDFQTEVTRAEYVNLMVRLMNMSEFKSTTGMFFRDVAADHPYYNEISLMKNLSYVDGDYGSLFRPDDTITYYEAMKLLVCVLGYEEYADLSGGYPTGHMMISRQNGLTLEKYGDDLMNRNDVAELAVRALLVPILKKVSFSTIIGYNANDNVTLLTEYFSIYNMDGIINSAGPVRINEGARMNESIAEISGISFDIGSAEALRYIGYKVTAYYRVEKDQQRNTLMFIDPLKNDVYEIDGEDIVSYNDSTSRLSYYTNRETGKQTTIRISGTDNVIYNNERTTNWDASDLENADRIRAIDHNYDGTFDAVFVDNEEVFMVKSINSADNKIFDNYKSTGGVLDIESDGKIKVVSITDIYGNILEVNTITFGSVLNVVKSKEQPNGSITTNIVATNQTITGQVAETISDGRSQELIVNGVSYKVAKNYNDITELSQVKIGGTYKFYLDRYNRIAGVELTGTTTEAYGYLVKAMMVSPMDNQPTVRIYTKDKVFLDTTLADKVTINGKTKLSGDNALAKILHYDSLPEGEPEDKIDTTPAPYSKSYYEKDDKGNYIYDGKGEKIIRFKFRVLGVVVKYKLNENNQITYIITPPEAAVETQDQYDYDSTVLNRYPFKSNPMYLRDISTFDGEVKIASSTSIFIAPPRTVDVTKMDDSGKPTTETIINPDVDDIKKYNIGNLDSFKSFSAYNKDNLFFYDVGKNRLSNAVLYFSDKAGGTEIDRNTRITIVTKKVKAVTKEGEEILKLYGMQAGKEISVEVAPGIDLVRHYSNPGDPKNSVYKQEVERGDIIRYGVDAEGRINDWEKAFDLDDQDNPALCQRNKYIGYSGVQKDESPGAMISLFDDSEDATKTTYYDAKMVHQGSNQYYFYAVQYKFFVAKLIDKIGDTIIYDMVSDTKGTVNVTKREMATLSRFTITVIDREADQIYKGDESYLTPEEVSPGNGTTMLIYLAGGIPRDMIIVK